MFTIKSKTFKQRENIKTKLHANEKWTRNSHICTFCDNGDTTTAPTRYNTQYHRKHWIKPFCAGGKTKRQERSFKEGYAFVRCACACESQVQFNVIRVTRSESVRVKKRERFEHNTQQWWLYNSTTVAWRRTIRAPVDWHYSMVNCVLHTISSDSMDLRRKIFKRAATFAIWCFSKLPQTECNWAGRWISCCCLIVQLKHWNGVNNLSGMLEREMPLAKNVLWKFNLNDNRLLYTS